MVSKLSESVDRVLGGKGHRAANVAGALLACLGIALTLLFELRVAPNSYRLALDLARLAGVTFFLNFAMVVCGAQIFRKIQPNATVPFVERVLFGMTLGFLAFGLGMYVLGTVKLFRPFAALGLPLVMGLAGASEIPRLWTEAKESLREASAASPALRLAGIVASLLGGVGVAFVYLEALTPDSFNFDAIWYHVPIAQDYARLGRIVPFFADNHRGYPHLASLLHTWALLFPGIDLQPLRWMLMLHLEFAMVIWRIVGAVALARFLLGGRSVPGLWAFFFLFPSLFIYDQNIGGSADHVLGATAVPIALALLRFLPGFDMRWAIVTGLAAAVHILTKYQAVYMVGVIAVLSMARGTWFLVARAIADKPLGVRFGIEKTALLPWKRAILAPLLIAGVALGASSPHFVKNVVFYQNPVYPFAKKTFESSFDDWKNPHPAKVSEKVKGAATGSQAEPKKASPPRSTPKKKGDPYDFRFSYRAFEWKPQGDGFVERFVWVHKTILEWPFFTANRNLTGQRPYMGGMFVLLLPTVFLLRDRRRFLAALAICYVAFGIWAGTTANDRYLLAFLSVPIGVAAALFVRLCELGNLAKLAGFVLVGIQSVASLSAPLEYGGERFSKAVQLVKRSTTARTRAELYPYRAGALRLSEALPKNAVILGRYYKDLLGVDRTFLNTHEPIQTYIPFGKLENERDLWQICHDRGITHLLYPPGKRQPELAQTLVLFDALFARTAKAKSVSGVRFAELPKSAPATTAPLLVLVKGVREYDDGLYRVSQLNRSARGDERLRPKPVARYKEADLDSLLDRADAILAGGRAPGFSRDTLGGRFEKFESFGSLDVWLKKSAD